MKYYKNTQYSKIVLCYSYAVSIHLFINKSIFIFHLPVLWLSRLIERRYLALDGFLVRGEKRKIVKIYRGD